MKEVTARKMPAERKKKKVLKAFIVARQQRRFQAFTRLCARLRHIPEPLCNANLTSVSVCDICHNEINGILDKASGVQAEAINPTLQFLAYSKIQSHCNALKHA